MKHPPSREDLMIGLKVIVMVVLAIAFVTGATAGAIHLQKVYFP